jgi:hypothetical protein
MTVRTTMAPPAAPTIRRVLPFLPLVLAGGALAYLAACTSGTTPVCDDAGSCLILPYSDDAGSTPAEAGTD